MIMGILNVTPDSFYDGGVHSDRDKVLSHVEHMVTEGMDILDIGGQSTRPGASKVPADREMSLILPVIRAVGNRFPDLIISVDTFYPEVAFAAIGEGAHIINDVYAGRAAPNMFETVAELQVPYVLMHSRGDASSMTKLTDYEDYLKDILTYFEQNIRALQNLGVKDIILDPGFGFAKTRDQNYRLLKHLEMLKIFELPVLVGVSRKSMIARFLGTTPEEALNGTTAVHTVALQKGASILRVHDVREAVEVRKIVEKLKHV